MQNVLLLKQSDTVLFLEIANILGIENPRFRVSSIYPGGMGICYKLQSIENHKNYALKCIRPDLIESDRLERFYDEINIWTTASACDGIAEAISVFRFNEVPAILSPWYGKGDLANWTNKLTPANMFEVLIRTVRTLSWAQSQLGIIHRDLKPANILLDDKYLSFLSDWGIARPLRNFINITKDKPNNRIIERPDRTQPGNLVGTILYMSPEQILNPENVDHRSDIYSLGCIMYEMETGSPPFIGSTIIEIMNKHINTPAPKLGGQITKTKLGLENVIDKCLSKSPDQRYGSYEELEEDLVSIANKKSYSLERCRISERYKRYPLGKGKVVLDEMFKNAIIKSKDGHYGILDLGEIQPFLSETNNLMALGRYSEAEKLLKPLVIPDLLEGNGLWHFGHTLALNYAYCLSNLTEHIERSVDIYQQLNKVINKPAEFYVNYSLVLLRLKNNSEALNICYEGIQQFPNDYDLLGNYTIALTHQGEVEKAYENAKTRIKIRRDVHSIEELVSVLFELMKSLRNIDLPKAINFAEKEFKLIDEGLTLNPNHHPLTIFKIKLFRFINDSGKALELSKSLVVNNNIPGEFRQVAFAEMVDILSEGEFYKTALDWIEERADSTENEEIKQRLLLMSPLKKAKN